MRVQSPSSEALRLYRDILRACRAFTWRNESGQVWGKVLAESARREFESARTVSDPMAATKMIIVGRHAFIKAQEKMAVKQSSVGDSPGASG
mmetsp:Transcript_5427/g.16199  ORF Transcript_5427/g.16199 Transcript_5427/m.16199 type:complete len:92 (+) Transcript_5427:94-369(+)